MVGEFSNAGSAAMWEIIGSFILSWIAMATTCRKEIIGRGPIAIGLAYAALKVMNRSESIVSCHFRWQRFLFPEEI